VNTFFVAARDEIHLCACFAARVACDAAPALSGEHIAHVWEAVAAAMARFHWPGQRRAIQEICSIVLPGGATADSLRLA
jgi:hypothetical protein